MPRPSTDRHGGTLTLANSYTYSTWGTPTTATHNGIADLGFRFLYVGAQDVQWDDFSGAGLTYMHARTYLAAIGRFLQPDPEATEANVYGYAGNNPVRHVDCEGTDYRRCAVIAVRMFIAYLQLVRRRQGIVTNWRLPWAGHSGVSTVATHQEKFREWQRNAMRQRDMWDRVCDDDDDGPRLPPGFLNSLNTYTRMPTPSPVRKPPPYLPPRFSPRELDVWIVRGGLLSAAGMLGWAAVRYGGGARPALLN
jgi:RHS repeat-associated protein